MWARWSRSSRMDMRRPAGRRGADQVGEVKGEHAVEHVHRILETVQWCMGLNETTWGSLSCRKPNSASDSERRRLTMSGNGQSRLVNRIRLPSRRGSSWARARASVREVSRARGGRHGSGDGDDVGDQRGRRIAAISASTLVRSRRVRPRASRAGSSVSRRRAVARVRSRPRYCLPPGSPNGSARPAGHPDAATVVSR